MGAGEIGNLERKNRRSKDSHLTEYDSEHYLVKEELTHYGAKKVILKNKKDGKITEKILAEKYQS